MARLLGRPQPGASASGSETRNHTEGSGHLRRIRDPLSPHVVIRPLRPQAGWEQFIRVSWDAMPLLLEMRGHPTAKTSSRWNYQDVVCTGEHFRVPRASCVRFFESCRLAVRIVAAGTLDGKIGVSKADAVEIKTTMCLHARCLSCIHLFSRVDLLGGNGWHQSRRENGRDWKARPALQKKLDRQAASCHLLHALSQFVLLESSPWSGTAATMAGEVGQDRRRLKGRLVLLHVAL